MGSALAQPAWSAGAALVGVGVGAVCAVVGALRFARRGLQAE